MTFLWGTATAAHQVDSLGTGVGRFVGGWLAQLLTVGPALTISSLFRLPCGVLLLFLVRLFPRDVETLRADMQAVARELLERGKTTRAALPR